MHYVYALENLEGEHYIGYTSDLRKRLTVHNQGKSFSTQRNQWHRIYYEANLEEADARRREKYFKTNQAEDCLNDV